MAVISDSEILQICYTLYSTPEHQPLQKPEKLHRIPLPNSPSSSPKTHNRNRNTPSIHTRPRIREHIALDTHVKADIQRSGC